MEATRHEKLSCRKTRIPFYKSCKFDAETWSVEVQIIYLVTDRCSDFERSHRKYTLSILQWWEKIRRAVKTAGYRGTKAEIGVVQYISGIWCGFIKKEPGIISKENPDGCDPEKLWVDCKLYKSDDAPAKSICDHLPDPAVSHHWIPMKRPMIPEGNRKCWYDPEERMNWYFVWLSHRQPLQKVYFG